MKSKNKLRNIRTTLGHPAWLNSVPTLKVIEALQSNGAEVRFIGGCVRDTLAHRPVKDIDLATPTIPKGIIKLLKNFNIKALTTGIRHGTITAVCEQFSFQITTLRKDKKTDGRHAKVAFTDEWATDSRRRDFTINSISADPTGIIYDYNGGIADLKHGKVRFIGDAQNRIDEDYLRVLRFFRFQGEFGRLPIDSDILRILRSRANKLQNLSGERIRDELLKIFMGPDPFNVCRDMQKCGVLGVVLPEARNLKRLGYLTDLEKKTSYINGVIPKDFRRLAAIFDPKTDDASLSSAMERLKLSNTHRSLLRDIVKPETEPLMRMDKNQQLKLLRKFGPERTRDLILLDWANNLTLSTSIKSSQANSYISFLKICAAWTAPSLPLTGSDALNLGIIEGPQIGTILRRVEEWWESNGYTASRQKCLERMYLEVKKLTKYV